jgi:hypothetical protein
MSLLVAAAMNVAKSDAKNDTKNVAMSEYSIKFHTGTSMGAGTDADVSVELMGADGNSVNMQ